MGDKPDVWQGTLALKVWMLAKLSSSFLYGIRPHDVVTFTLEPAVLVLVALVAARIPARRAASINPTQALRME